MQKTRHQKSHASVPLMLFCGHVFYFSSKGFSLFFFPYLLWFNRRMVINKVSKDYFIDNFELADTGNIWAEISWGADQDLSQDWHGSRHQQIDKSWAILRQMIILTTTEGISLKKKIMFETFYQRISETWIETIITLSLVVL